ncbi:MAG: Mu transposase C-terminal domain-containing protein [Sporolactobacillus sp.]
MQEPPPLTFFSDEQRQAAVEKFTIISPYLTNEKKLQAISKEFGISRRTLHYWVSSYEKLGLKGLVRKKRNDAEIIRVDSQVKKQIERLILQHKRNSVASIYRKVCTYCKQNHLEQPSYYQVMAVSKSLTPGMKKLAFEGTKQYKNEYDLIHTRQAIFPNEIWQADHTLLDIFVLNEKGNPQRPWLTIIMDDYSRAIAGYFLSFHDPSAMQTSLAFHQAIWQKKNKDWPICGIPENFYTDHGSDFTSNHLEQVAIDLKINLIFSSIGVPRGRGKIERFFSTVNQLLLQDLPGYIGQENNASLLTFKELEDAVQYFIIHNYHHRIHGTTKKMPIISWNESGFLPNLPESLESLDLLLLNVAKARKVQQDGIHFQGLKYLNTNLAAYVGEMVLIRYDPRDLAEIRVFYHNEFLCTAISPEISDYTVDIQDIISARNKRRCDLKKQIDSAKTVVEEIVLKQQDSLPNVNDKKPKKTKLKRYLNE